LNHFALALISSLLNSFPLWVFLPIHTGIVCIYLYLPIRSYWWLLLLESSVSMDKFQ
jgi:hypothetical protein